MKAIKLGEFVWGRLAQAKRHGACLVLPRAGGKPFRNEYRRVNRFGRHTNVHRLVAQHFCSDYREDLQVRHTCNNRACINPDHLRMGTVADNARDMVEFGNPGKLTRDQVREIRRRYVPGTNQAQPGNSQELAKEFGCTPANIRMIAREDTWISI